MSSSLARRYAQAFLNVHPEFHDGAALKQVLGVLKNEKELYFYLKVSVIPDTIKKELLGRLLERYKVPELSFLVELLLAHKRIGLFKDVLVAVGSEYNTRKNRLVCTIKSWPCLTDAQLTKLVHYLEKKVKKQIEYTYYADPALIAGVRVESADYLWEYSLAAQVRRLRGVTQGDRYACQSQ